MSQVYRLTDEMMKEKSVGGLITFGQAGWLALGLLIFGILFVLFSRVMNVVIAFVLGLIPAAGIALPFAFYNKGGLSLCSYLMWRFRFERKSKGLVNTFNYRQDRARDFRGEQGEE